MVLSLSYRRPAYINDDDCRASISTEKSSPGESIRSGSSCAYGIPEALSFDKIVSGGTCPVSRHYTLSWRTRTKSSLACNTSSIHGLLGIH